MRMGHRADGVVFELPVAAFFLASLNQMMRVMGLPTALQFVVFGLVVWMLAVNVFPSREPGLARGFTRR